VAVGLVLDEAVGAGADELLDLPVARGVDDFLGIDRRTRVGAPEPEEQRPEGSLRWMITVNGSFASSASTLLQTAFPGVDIVPQRASEATTSAEVISLPLWNFTPLRRVIV
jgi:hypothetical protein